MNTGTITLYHRDDGREEIFGLVAHANMVSCGKVGAGRDWSSVKPPPLGWEFEVPKYRAVLDVRPSPNSRHRSEPPFSMTWENDVWQYASQPHQAGETIETKSWPHQSFRAINYSAERVLDFYNNRTKSRLPVSPWRRDRIFLDDGLSGPTQPNILTPATRPAA